MELQEIADAVIETLGSRKPSYLLQTVYDAHQQIILQLHDEVKFKYLQLGLNERKYVDFLFMNAWNSRAVVPPLPPPDEWDMDQWDDEE